MAAKVFPGPSSSWRQRLSKLHAAFRLWDEAALASEHCSIRAWPEVSSLNSTDNRRYRPKLSMFDSSGDLLRSAPFSSTLDRRRLRLREVDYDRSQRASSHAKAELPRVFQ